MTCEQLAYLAGIIDGEGSVGLYSKQTSKADQHSISLRVCVTNTSRTLIDWLMTTTNLGSVRELTKTAFTKRQAWGWSVCSRQAVELLRLVRPWLIVKGPQADIVLAIAAMEKTEGIRQGVKPSNELRAARIEAARTVKALKLVA